MPNAVYVPAQAGWYVLSVLENGTLEFHRDAIVAWCIWDEEDTCAAPVCVDLLPSKYYVLAPNGTVIERHIRAWPNEQSALETLQKEFDTAKRRE